MEHKQRETRFEKGHRGHEARTVFELPALQMSVLAHKLKKGGIAVLEVLTRKSERGARCSCRPGMARDNCSACEGTGWRIDFAAIRARRPVMTQAQIADETAHRAAEFAESQMTRVLGEHERALLSALILRLLQGRPA